MKTNHRRSFIAKKISHNAMWQGNNKDKKLGIIVYAQISNDFSNGHRGEAKQKIELIKIKSNLDDYMKE